MEAMGEPTITLRPYQQQILADTRAAIAAGHKRILISSPTGSGKTTVGLAMMRGAAERGHFSAVMVERIVLADQWCSAALEAGLDAGIIQAERGERGAQATIYSQQTTESRSERLSAWPEQRLVVVDEAHVQRSAITEWIRSPDRAEKAPNQVIIGMTATPHPAGLGDTYTALVQGPTTRALTDDGWLVPLEVWQAKARMDMDRHKVQATGEWAGKDIDDETALIVGDVAGEWLRVAQDHFTDPPKTLVFSSTVASGKKLCDAFNGLGLGEIAVQISYKDSRDARESALRRFRGQQRAGEGGEVYLLINVSVVGRGFDVPDASVLIDASPYRSSFASYAQMIGRVLRPAAKRAADGERAIVFDHCGNFQRFYPAWCRFVRDGVTELRPDPPPEESRMAWPCPECDALNWLRDGRTCRKCGAALQDETDRENPVPKIRAWRCGKCGAPNRPGAVACVDCGARRKEEGDGVDQARTWACPECGTENPHHEYRCGARDDDGRQCEGEKPEHAQEVEGELERFDVPSDPEGCDTSIDMQARGGRRYAWAHLSELALRHYLKRQKSVTARLWGKAQSLARVRFQRLYGYYPDWPLCSVREPVVDPRLEGWWEQVQAEYAAQYAPRTRGPRGVRR